MSTSLPPRPLLPAVAALVALALTGGCSLTDGPAGGLAPTEQAEATGAEHDDETSITEDAETPEPAATETGTGGDPAASSGPGTSPGATSTDGGAGGQTGADGSVPPTGQVDPAGLDLTDLTVSWPCGYGFELSHPDGTATLVLEWTTPEPELPRLVLLPDPRWQARLYVGENLAAVSCTPGIEPEGAVETWEVLAGTLRFAGGGSVPEMRVQAELSGIVVGAPDGSRLEMPNQQVTNTGWGVSYDQ